MERKSETTKRNEKKSCEQNGRADLFQEFNLGLDRHYPSPQYDSLILCEKKREEIPVYFDFTVCKIVPRIKCEFQKGHRE